VACCGPPLIPHMLGVTGVGNLIERPIQLSEGPGSDERLESLVRRARNGDTIAFRELYAGYFRRVYAYTYLRLGEREQARDAVQDVFLGVWRGLPARLLAHGPSVGTPERPPSAYPQRRLATRVTPLALVIAIVAAIEFLGQDFLESNR
jgi:hypothetical protein